MKSYLIYFFLLLAAAAGIIGLVPAEATILEIRWMLLAYFAAVTFFFHLGINKTSNGRPQVFVRYFMAATSIKLFLHLGVIVFYAFSHKTLAYDFIVNFMIYYLIFTVFEVVMTFKKSK